MPNKSALTPDQAEQRLQEKSRRFIGNAGQWDSNALFLARAGKMDMWVTKNGFTYDFYRPTVVNGESGKTGHVVQMSFNGGSGGKVVGVSPVGMVTRYINPKAAHTADSYSEVIQKGIYPGVDARSYFDGGMPRYDLIVAPGADARQIKLDFKGANKITVKNGEIIIATQVGDQKQGKLFVYQNKNGKRVQIPASFKQVGKNTVAFSLGNYDRSKQLIIDPLIYGSYYGGNGGIDQVSDVTSDAKGGVYLTGYTASPNFPAIYGPYGFTIIGQRDGFISKLQGDAYDHDYAAYFGGTANDEGLHIDVDPFGDVWVSGITASGNFPGGNLLFLKKTSASTPTSGTFTITYPGIGTTVPLPYNINTNQLRDALQTLLGVGGVKVTAQSESRVNQGGTYKIILPPQFPATPTVNSSGLSPNSTYSIPGRVPHVFLMRWAQDPNTVLSPFPQAIMYFGGEQTLSLINMAIVPNTNPTATEPVRLTFAGTQSNGAVSNSDIPQNPIPGSNGFIARYEYDRQSRTFARVAALTRFISSTDGRANVELNGMDVDRFGNVYAGGTVRFDSVADTSVDPVFQTTAGVFPEGRLLRLTDMFVRKYGANGNLIYSALIGGNNIDNAGGIDVDATGAASTVGSCIAVDEALNLYITGIGRSFNYPRTLGVYGEVFNEQPVVVCTKINPDASQILYSTHLRTTGLMLPAGIGVDTRGNAFITGNAHPDVMEWSDTGNPLAAGDPNEPTGSVRGSVPVTADAIDNNWAEADTTSADGRTHPASYPPAPQLGTSEGWVLVLNSTATELMYGSYIGQLTDERVFAPYVDQVGDVWFFGYLDTTRQYVVVSSQGVQTPRTLSGGLNWHINELAFKRFPDTSSANRLALNIQFGTWNALFPFYVNFSWSPAATPPGFPKPTQATQFQRDGFIIKQRFTIPSVDSVVVTPTNAPGGLGQTVQGTVTLSQPAPVGGAVVTLELSNDAASFSNTSDVTELSINIAAGETVGTFTAFTRPVQANTNVQVKANYQGSFKIAQFVVIPWLQDLSITPTSVVGGNIAVGRITLAQPAPTGGVNVELTTDTPSLVSFPAGTTVNVPEGQTFASFNIETQGVSEPTFPTIRASLLGVGITRPLTITQASLQRLVFTPSRVAGGTTTIGTIFLDGKAGSAFDIFLSIDSGTAGYKLPKKVTVEPGATSVTFELQTAFESTNTSRVVTATRPQQGTYPAQTIDATIFVDAVFLTNFVLSPTIIDGGATATGTVTISSPAPAGGVVVNLKSSNNSIATVPSQVIVPAGASVASFQINGQTIAVDRTVDITASRGLATFTRQLTVRGVTFTMMLDPASVVGGRDASTGTITLSSPAPATGVTIRLRSSNSAAQVPTTITIDPGQTTGTFTVTTSTVPTTRNATIRATLGSNEVTADLEIRSIGVLSVQFTPDRVRGGNTTLLTITLEAEAPSTGATVSLSATDPSLFAFLPSTVTIEPGQTSVTITLRTRRVSRTLATTVSATFGGSSASATLVVDR